MKLNQYTKDAIVRAIMADVPETNGEKIKADIQAALVKAMSTTARKLYKENPNALREIYVANIGLGYRTTFIGGDADKDVVLKPWIDAYNAKMNTRNSLREAVYGCSTLKQLKDRMPEFIKYFPTEAEPTKNLPAVVNVLPALTALGWPVSKVSK